jgi:hypothetical protein
MPARISYQYIIVYEQKIYVHLVVSVIRIPVVPELNKGVAEYEPSVERRLFDIYIYV